MGRFELNTVLITGLFLLLSFCNGPSGQHKSNETPGSNSLGKLVSGLDSAIWVIYQDKNLNYWFGSKENGVYKYDGENLFHFSTSDGLPGNQVRGIQEDYRGNIYIETTEGISLYNGKTFLSLEAETNSANLNQWKSEPNDLWFSAGYHKNGVYRYDGKSLYHLTFPKAAQETKFKEKNPNVSHNPYGVYTIFKDSKDHLWFGTADMGIYQFNGKRMGHLYKKELTETPEGGAFGIRSIAEDNEGFFWICTPKYKYQIIREDRDSKDLIPLKYEQVAGVKNKEHTTLYFLSIINDNGKLWMLTFNNGVWQKDGSELIHYPLLNENNPMKLLSMYRDRQGALWLGTQNSGVFRFNGTSFEKFGF